MVDQKESDTHPPQTNNNGIGQQPQDVSPNVKCSKQALYLRLYRKRKKEIAAGILPAQPPRPKALTNTERSRLFNQRLKEKEKNAQAERDAKNLHDAPKDDFNLKNGTTSTAPSTAPSTAASIKVKSDDESYSEDSASISIKTLDDETKQAIIKLYQSHTKNQPSLLKNSNNSFSPEQ